MNRERLSALLVLPMLLGIIQTARAQRTTTTIDDGWLYLERAESDVRAVARVPTSAWSPVSLPHTWNALDATDNVPGYRRSASWYRRSLDLSRTPAGSRVLLHFEGANTVADVYANGVRAGGHVGGYLGFDVDITPFVQRTSHEEILVRVDNTDDPDLIPSSRSDFVIYGGLTRDVQLVVTPATSIERVTIRTPAVSAERARMEGSISLRNPRRIRGDARVDITLADPQGRVVARTNWMRRLNGDTASSTAFALAEIVKPALWSPASPSLYRLSVLLTQNGQRDSVTEPVGFRFYRFEEKGPFYLNGERLLIRGTHRHEEHAGVGAAVSNAQHRKDLEMIKAMGANFVRLAHYPQDPEIYRTADSLGLLLWDELPWDRGGLGGERWKDITRRLLREQMVQNGNHPSIILWSLGNEVQDVIEEGHDGTTPSLRGFLSELRLIARELDPARPTSMRKFDAGADLVDVYSPSIWAGWYRGVYRGYEQAIAEARDKFTRFFHMEYGADAHVGRHTDTPISGEGLRVDPGFEEAVGKPVANIARDGDWSESYQTDLMDWHLMISEQQPWLTGNAQWVFKDFATPLRPDNPIPYVNQKGLLTRDGTPKDAYYLYKSWWTTSPSFAYIVSHTWTERSGPAGKPRQVRVYSNCARVELLVDGKSGGTKPRVRTDFPAQGLRWDVTFTDGPHALIARCEGAERAADTLGIRYTSEAAGRPTDIKLVSHPLSNGRVLVEALLIDAKGRRSLDAQDRMFFDHNGGGRLIADQGTPTGSRIIEAANGRAAIEVELPPKGSRAVIIVRTQELNGARLILEGSR